MLRRLIPIIMLCLLVGIAKGQESEFGLKIGGQITKLGGKKIATLPAFAYSLGASYENYYSEFISFNVEGIFSMQGAVQDANREVKLKYLYFNAPVYLKLYGTEHAFVEIGVQPGVLINAREVYKSLGTDNITSQVKTFDFSMLVGLGYRLWDHGQLNLRYALGVTNTAKRDVAYEFRHTNRVLSLSYTYVF